MILEEKAKDKPEKSLEMPQEKFNGISLDRFYHFQKHTELSLKGLQSKS